MLQRTREKSFLKGAVILTIAGLLTKMLSAGYRIPYQNIAGDIGFYIYQQVYPFYGISIILATYGFPVIISKLIAEKVTEKNVSDVQTIVRGSFLYLSVISFMMFLPVYLGAQLIANWMGDEQLELPIRVVAFTYLFIPAVSVFRGYFQGYKNMVPTAVSQLVEQSTRVSAILLFSYILFSQGYSVYEGGAGAVFGSLIGGFFAIFILLFFYLKKREDRIKEDRKIMDIRVLKTVVIQGVIICASSLFLVLLQLVDSMTVLMLLQKSGLNEVDAKVAKGVFDRGQPLIQLGTVVATSISLTIVPFISSAYIKKEMTFIKEKVELALRVSVVVGLGASVGLIAIIEPTNIMLFEDAKGSTTLAVLALSILFSSIMLTSSAILQGLNKSMVPAIHVLYGVSGKLMANTIFIPFFGTTGAAVSTVLACALAASLNVKAITCNLDLSIFKRLYLFKTMKAAVIMLFFLTLYQVLIIYGFHMPQSRLFSTFQSLSSVAIGGFSYIYVVITTGIFHKNELSILPFGSKMKAIRK